ncbi:UDP-N-acetylglucosamine--undecaprenyl-phosphate N-acetylglucosaminephosphotransferase [Marinobacter sp.]|uniref:UDP-N-acetylglucosamine--undecaprenyl-phosphate N-acetylglucosaminephosphotransferase n=1 Tax=Marinobacter sp. TaxID=50741 RepID=UPI000C5663E2|nr:UDP-N-acetylglucosamine--undecaprenyl-phosphate N-acetylglucosaminephosphotransferase [Marinobacter sp.]MAO13066.1 undecaprenyl-phosphate alpha-N-acetylglucosaminyl 1-phosphatetransferase [Marinobacter sp.]|tara:strand:+ start:428 stop:1489 length:1062 start_codon:yes stop_codon:yes gene_type:complete
MEAASSAGLLAGFFALLSMIVLRPVAQRVKLLDQPDHRKLHKGAVPLIGGLSAFVGFGVAWLIWMPVASAHSLFLVCAALLVMVGAVDDARDLPAKFRLAVQVVLGAVLTFGSGISLTTFGDLFGFGEISLGYLGPWVTIAAVIGATNAFNMVDGIDGLAGSLSLVALVSLAFVFMADARFNAELVLAIAIACALVPYMMANLRIPPFRCRIFMGDAGSMFIGFAVVWLLVNATQPGEMAMRPVTALWIIAIPLMDMVAIMVRRARKGQSLMKPDREHLHHIFMRAGFSDREALLMITIVALVFAGIGLAGEYFDVAEWLMFTAFVGLFAVYDWSLSHVWRLLVLFRKKVAHH